MLLRLFERSEANFSTFCSGNAVAEKIIHTFLTWGIQILYVETEGNTHPGYGSWTATVFRNPTLFFPCENVQNDLNPIVEYNWDWELEYFCQKINSKINK